MAKQIAEQQMIIQTQKLVVIPNFETLKKYLPIPKMVVLGFTLEEYLLQCLAIRLPTTHHELNVHEWVEILKFTMGTSLDIGLAQSLWPLTEYIQFHEAFSRKLNDRQTLWKKHHTLVQSYTMSREAISAVSLLKNVDDNVEHVKRKMLDWPIGKQDDITFRGPYVKLGVNKPITITTTEEVDASGIGSFLYTPFVLPLKDILENEEFGMSLIPGCMSSWLDWKKQLNIALTNSAEPLNKRCSYVLTSDHLLSYNPLLLHLTELSMQTLIEECDSNIFMGIAYVELQKLTDAELFEAIHTARHSFKAGSPIDKILVKINIGNFLHWRELEEFDDSSSEDN
jgi:hypothetical protein